MIHLSQAAISEILRLKAKRNNPELLFRLGIQPSACLSLSYVMTFDMVVHSNDELFSCSGIQVVIDAHSLSAVTGLTLDYSEDLMGGGFRFHNPNAIRSCGCGNAFSLGEPTP
ncbi:MAG: iron-sulfur cluster assembly accessory protein [Stenomitos rutilans HA7619-LM2]|jgi:iron-sulfur cluster assembly accessory protein|nr:iron-sulfur cluster assembly accessory protein [Stenomitos rutilans HA7619-LM2]